MPFNEDNVFTADLITDARKVVSEYQFSLQGISTPVRLRVYEYTLPEDVRGSFGFDTSHHVKTPANPAGPYRTSVQFLGSAAEAFHRAVDSITKFYALARQSGHEPKAEWLVRNEDF